MNGRLQIWRAALRDLHRARRAARMRQEEMRQRRRLEALYSA